MMRPHVWGPYLVACLCIACMPRPRSIVSAVPLGNRGHKARSLDDVQSPEVGIFFTSCFKIGPYASAVHPQDVLGGHADDISLLHHSHPHEVLQQRGQEELKGKTGEWAADGDIELTAFASDGSTVVQRSGSTVTVTWKGVPWLAMPFEYWIGVWLEGENTTETAPIKFHFVAPDLSIPDTLRTSYTMSRDNASTSQQVLGLPKRQGHVSFYLLNYRRRMVVRMMRGRTQQWQVASSAPLTFANLEGEPTNGHISIHPMAPSQGVFERFIAGTSAVGVHWSTGMHVAAGGATQRVQYGFATGNLTMEAIVWRAETYSSADMCGGIASSRGYRAPGLQLSAIVQGLVPGARIFYRYGSQEDGWSEEAVFVAPYTPSAGGSGVAEPLTRIFAFGDLGQHSPDDSFQHCDCAASRRTIDGIGRLVKKDGLLPLPPAHLVLHIGDLSYAKGYAAEWDALSDQIEPLARGVPYMTAIGNHERDWPDSGSNVGHEDSGGECGVAYAARFPMPLPMPLAASLSTSARGAKEGAARVAQKNRPWYSFDQGLVHIAVLSSEHPAAEQVAWLQADLKAVNRNATPWIIVAQHRPMYVTGIDGSAFAWRKGEDYDVAAQMRQAYEAVLARWRVDLVLAGHHHSYQRTCPILNMTCAPQVAASRRTQRRETGSGAHLEYHGPVHVIVGMGGYANSPIMTPAAHQFVFTDSLHHGFSRISATRQNLTFEYLVPDVLGAHASITSKPREEGCTILDHFVMPVQRLH